MLRTQSPTRPRTIDELLGSQLAARLNQLDVASRKVFAGKLKGERKSKKRGESVEFADHRSYVVGDDLRHIDWNIFGRLDKLFLKLFLEEEDLSLQIVIDCSESMACGEPEKFLFVQKAAAALAYIGLVNMHRVTLTAVGEAVPQAGQEEAGGNSVAPTATAAVGAAPGGGGIRSVLRNLRGKRRASDMAAWVCSLEPGGPANFAEAAKRIALTRTGKGVMIVLSDFLFKEGYEQGLRYLIGHGYDVVIMQVLSPQEIDPQLGGDLRLKDVEDADATEVTISAPLLKKYKETLASFCADLRKFCAQREMAHLTLPSNTPVDALVMDYLRSRGVLK